MRRDSARAGNARSAGACAPAPPDQPPAGRFSPPASSLSLEPLPRPEWVRRRLGGATGAGVRVAVVDSGWDPGLALAGLRLEPGVSVGSAGELLSEPPVDRTGHGTACLCTAFRIAPDATYTPVRVFGESLTTSIAALVAALEWAVERRFDVVNLSLGVGAAAEAEALYRACGAAAAAHCVVVAAATEAGDTFPARFDNVLSVGVGGGGDPFGYEYRAGEGVECRAPRGIYGLVPSLEGRIVPADGPSYAAPVVAGIVALIRERHPCAPLPAVRAHLARHAVARTPPGSAGVQPPQDEVGHEALLQGG